MKDDEVISLDDEGERQMDASDELLQMATPSALLTLDGAIRSLNAAMARTLGRSVEQCVGRGFGDLLPASQLTAVKSLVAHAATTKTVAMRVLEFPGPGRPTDEMRLPK